MRYIESVVVVSLVSSLGGEQEDEDEVSAGQNGGKPMEPTPSLGLDQKATDHRSHCCSQSQPLSLDAGLYSSFVQEEKIV